VVSQAIFEAKETENSTVKFQVEVLSVKNKYDNGITVRKCRVTRRIYRKRSFFEGPSTSACQDDVSTLRQQSWGGGEDFFDTQEEIKNACSSTTKAELN